MAQNRGTGVRLELKLLIRRVEHSLGGVGDEREKEATLKKKNGSEEMFGKQCR